MTFDFPRLIAHITKTRNARAGTILGSGTISNYDRSRGSACLAERRTLEQLEHGKPVTPFLKFGDRVRIEMLDAGGQQHLRRDRSEGSQSIDQAVGRTSARLRMSGCSPTTVPSAALSRPGRASAPESTAAASERSSTARSRACASGSAIRRRAARRRTAFNRAARLRKYTSEAAPTPNTPRPNSATFRYTSRMRCLGHSVSMSTVKYASRPLRSQLCSGHRNRFFATCCEIVLAPRTRRPRSTIFQRIVDRLQIEAVVRGEVLIFRRDHRDLDLRRDVRVVDPAVADRREQALADHERGSRRIDPAQRQNGADAQHDPGCERPANEAQRTPKHVGQASA